MNPSDQRLTKRADIRTAIDKGVAVYADCSNLPDRLPVRDVKMQDGILRVRLLEGWRVPFFVYVESK